MNGFLTRWQPGWRMLVGLLLVMAMPGSVIAGADTGSQPEYALFAVTDNGRTYQPLDPATLDDVDSVEPMTFDNDWMNVAVSADGSTTVMIDPSQGPLEDWISVRDGLGGSERLAIDVEKAVYNPRLSADGSRVIASPSYGCGSYGCGERDFYTYDTRTGELISTVSVDLNSYVWPDMIGPGGERLYIPFYEAPPPPTYPATPTPPGISETGPWPLGIAAYDLTTGEEIGRLTVPDVLAGTWRDITITHSYASQVVRPAIAMSLDGTTIAVVDAAMESLTLIDTSTLEVIATREIREPSSAASDFLRWLGVLPKAAAAKVSEGRSLTASFSTDGRSVYVTGTEMSVGEAVEDVTGVGLGVTRIDVASGEVMATGLAGEDAHGVDLSPDGKWLYVLMPVTPWWEWERNSGGSISVVHRLDAETLEQEAERAFAAEPFVQVKLFPQGPAV